MQKELLGFRNNTPTKFVENITKSDAEYHTCICGMVIMILTINRKQLFTASVFSIVC